MPFHVRDPETDALVRELARVRGVGITEAVKQAAKDGLAQEKSKRPLWDRIQHLTFADYSDTGLKADKAFFDDLSGE